jgi:transposase
MDGPAALGLLDRLDPRSIVLADKAYDADGIRNLIEVQGAVPSIPAKSNRKWKPCFSKVLYRERNLVERFFSIAPVHAGPQNPKNIRPQTGGYPSSFAQNHRFARQRMGYPRSLSGAQFVSLHTHPQPPLNRRTL